MRFLALRANAGGSLIGLFVFSCMALFGDWFVADGIWKQYQATDYSPVFAVVTRSDIVEGRTAKGRTTYTFQLLYEYSVDNVRRLSSRVRYYEMANSDKLSAQRLQVRYPLGKQLTAFYDPNNPNDAILNPGVTTGDGIRTLVAIPLTLLLIGAWRVALDTKPEFDPAQAFETQAGLTVRLQSTSHLRVMVVVGGWSAVAAGTVLGIMSSYGPIKPEMLIAVGTSACALGCAAAAVFARYPVLAVDTEGRELVLPGSWWGEPVRVSFDVISQVDVVSVERRAGRWRSRYEVYDCVLSWVDFGKVQRTSIDTFIRRDAAEALKEWIVETTGTNPLEATYIQYDAARY